MRTLENTPLYQTPDMVHHITDSDVIRLRRDDASQLPPDTIVIYDGNACSYPIVCAPDVLRFIPQDIHYYHDFGATLTLMDYWGNLFEVVKPHVIRSATRSAYYPTIEAEILYAIQPAHLERTYTQDMGQVIHYYGHEFYQDHEGNTWFSEERRDEWNENNQPDPVYLDEGTCHPPAHFARFTENGDLEGGSTIGYMVGLEIEKQDERVLYSMEYDEFKRRFPLWHKVRDGSLGEYGFELHSPIMPLTPEKIAQYIRGNRHLLDCVNAYDDSECGGHVNISDPDRTPWELFDDIAGYVPLLCALYPSRASNDYCKARPKVEMVQHHEKYQALRVKRDCVEIRIFPAVVDIDRLKWRLELVRYMMDHPAPSPKMVNLKLMRPLLSRIHRSPSARIQFEERLKNFAQRLR